MAIPALHPGRNRNFHHLRGRYPPAGKGEELLRLTGTLVDLGTTQRRQGRVAGAASHTPRDGRSCPGSLRRRDRRCWSVSGSASSGLRSAAWMARCATAYGPDRCRVLVVTQCRCGRNRIQPVRRIYEKEGPPVAGQPPSIGRKRQSHGRKGTPLPHAQGATQHAVAQQGICRQIRYVTPTEEFLLTVSNKLPAGAAFPTVADRRSLSHPETHPLSTSSNLSTAHWKAAAVARSGAACFRPRRGWEAQP